MPHNGFRRVHVHAFDGPIGHAGFVEPVLEELVPRSAGIFLQLALEVGDAEDAEGIAGVDAAHEVEEGRLAEPVLDHADDLAALVVAHAEEIDDVAELGHFLDTGAGLAPTDGTV